MTLPFSDIFTVYISNRHIADFDALYAISIVYYSRYPEKKSMEFSDFFVF